MPSLRTGSARWLAALAVAAAMLAAALAFARTGSGEGEPGPPAPGRVVVLELFTSEGCSSCPPADRLLAHLAADPALDGKIVPLAFHVDYWNHLGWRDPFSSPRWSERQERYARALSGRLYTPQLVVDGHRDAVGSQEGAVRAALGRALAVEPAGRVGVTAGEIAGGRLPVRVTAQLDPERAEGPAEVWLAVFENGLASAVPRGENAGRELHHDHVVRQLEKVFRLSPDDGGRRRSESLTVPLEPEWNPEHLGVAAFLQDPESLEILAAAEGAPTDGSL
jgi:hypothetical protein